jgi:hypothetical protein
MLKICSESIHAVPSGAERQASAAKLAHRLGSQALTPPGPPSFAKAPSGKPARPGALTFGPHGFTFLTI